MNANMQISVNTQTVIIDAFQKLGITEFLRQVQTALLHDTDIVTVAESERLEYAAKEIARLNWRTEMWIDKDSKIS